MPINITIANDNAELVLNDIRQLFPQLAGPLPPMQEQPIREPAPPVNDNPAPKKRGAKKDAAGESSDNAGSASSTEGDAAAKGESASTAGTQESSATSSSTTTSTPSASDTQKDEILDIDLVRAKLKQMGATDGLGHDKVFEVLGKYKATNASGVPEGKRAELIAEIDALLAGVGK